MKNIYFSFLFLLGISLLSCSHRDEKNPNDLKGKKDAVIEAGEMAAYNSIQNLVMTGYQGWFSAAGDESKRGWYHYKNTNCGGFHPGCSSVDFWPDITDEYVKTYPSPFHFEDGSTAPLFSSYDKETVDLHFKWMQDYGIDGAYIQRFIVEVKPENAEGKRHFDQVLRNALKAAKKYNRAISIMYDLSGCTSEEVLLVEQDWAELVKAYKLDDLTQNPTYLHHNGKPLVSIWG